MNYVFNRKYVSLVSSLDLENNPFLKDPYKKPSVAGYICKAISEEFDRVDKLQKTLDDIKAAHMDEVYKLKKEISELIDRQYKQFKEQSCN